jgi:two-component sensor histidine kinase
LIFQIDDEIFKDEKGEDVQLFINGNESLLADMLNNFIENAVKHAFSPTEKNRVEL